MTQIALPLERSKPPVGVPIILGAGNKHVADALQKAEDWPFGTAVLAGPPRSGKTRFADWFASHTGGGAIDDAHEREETDVFHAWNRAREDGYPLLLTVSDAGWPIQLPDLASRIGAALPLHIGPPDDLLAGDLLLAHAERRGLALGDDARSFLVPRMVRSYAAIERLVAEMDRLSLERKQPATMSIWRDALAVIDDAGQSRLL